MTGELLRTVLGYIFAFTVFLFGGWFFWTGYLDPNALALPQEAEAFTVALVGFMGMALQWVFGTATQAATAKQTATATESGVTAALTPVPGPTITATGGNPPTVTATPAAPGGNGDVVEAPGPSEE